MSKLLQKEISFPFIKKTKKTEKRPKGFQVKWEGEINALLGQIAFTLMVEKGYRFKGDSERGYLPIGGSDRTEFFKTLSSTLVDRLAYRYSVEREEVRKYIIDIPNHFNRIFSCKEEHANIEQNKNSWKQAYAAVASITDPI